MTYLLEEVNIGNLQGPKLSQRAGALVSLAAGSDGLRRERRLKISMKTRSAIVRDVGAFVQQFASTRVKNHAPLRSAVVKRRGRPVAEASASRLVDRCPCDDSVSCVVCASDLTSFQKRVLHTICHIPPGHVTTYGDLAKSLASHPRAVGQALRRNPFNREGCHPRVPCHRVLSSDLHLGGFSGVWDPKHPNGMKKRNMLEQEGLEFDDKYRVVSAQRRSRVVRASDEPVNTAKVE